jgi:hypothetical protein
LGRIQIFGITLKDKNCMNEETECRLKLKNACYHLIQIFSSCFLFEKVQIKIYRNKIFLLFYMGRKTGLSNYGKNVG